MPDFAVKTEDAIPMGSCGEPIEIGNVALYLVSGEASYVTGTRIVADGGLLAHTGLPSVAGGGPDW